MLRSDSLRGMWEPARFSKITRSAADWDSGKLSASLIQRQGLLAISSLTSSYRRTRQISNDGMFPPNLRHADRPGIFGRIQPSSSLPSRSY